MHHQVLLPLPEVKVPTPFQGFIDFIREQGVVGLGVGFVVGTSANAVVHSLVTNVLSPLVGIFTGGVELNQKAVCLTHAATGCVNKLNYGQTLSDLLNFIVILVVVYFLVKKLKLESLQKKEEVMKRETQKG